MYHKGYCFTIIIKANKKDVSFLRICVVLMAKISEKSQFENRLIKTKFFFYQNDKRSDCRFMNY